MSRMLEEIRQQPEALERTLASESRKLKDFSAVLSARRPRLIVLAARGTSDNAAQFGRYLLEALTGIPVSLAAPSIYTLYDARVDLSGALVIAISQSGESTDTNLVLERARQQGAITAGITNEPASSLAKLAEHVFLVRAGKETSVAATKTYTGQILILYLIALALGAPLKMRDLERIPQWTRNALSLEKSVAQRSERYRFLNHAVVVGRGLNYANAFELALKLMETCYVVAERFSSADFLHGPIALVEPNFPVFLFGPSGVTSGSILEMVAKLDELRAETLVITDRSHAEAAKLARALVIPARIPEWFTPIPYIVPGQLLAAHLAEQKGLNPDQPRTLKKVTQTL